ncbi:MAG: aminotransferase class IV [Pseudomonadota bacterium]
MSTCYLNGAYLPLTEARISALDRGFIFGDAIYEVIPVYDGQLFAVDAHLERLRQSLTSMGFDFQPDSDQLLGVITELVRLNAEATTIYLQISRGVAARQHHPPAGLEPTIFSYADLTARPQSRVDAKAITLDDFRWSRCDAKTTALIANVVMRQQAARANVNEAILIRDGCVTEGAATNVFVVFDQTVITPPLSEFTLGGITRQCIIELITNLDRYPLQEAVVTEELLRKADEVWLSSSSRELSAVSEIDGQSVGNGDYPIADDVYKNFQQALARWLS